MRPTSELAGVWVYCSTLLDPPAPTVLGSDRFSLLRAAVVVPSGSMLSLYTFLAQMREGVTAAWL